jgi:hypothetical protein
MMNLSPLVLLRASEFGDALESVGNVRNCLELGLAKKILQVGYSKAYSSLLLISYAIDRHQFSL